MKVCSIDGCERQHVARGWCALHYNRWRAHGDPLTVQKIPAHAFAPGRAPWNKGTAARHTCVECGTEFVRHGRARNPRYCTKACQHRAVSGDRHPAWRGGVTPENERLRKSAAYLAWRAAVFARDDFTCQTCGQRGGDLQADHVEQWATHPELRFDVDNGRTLCVPCHRATPTYGRPVRRTA